MRNFSSQTWRVFINFLGVNLRRHKFDCALKLSFAHFISFQLLEINIPFVPLNKWWVECDLIAWARCKEKRRNIWSFSAFFTSQETWDDTAPSIYDRKDRMKLVFKFAYALRNYIRLYIIIILRHIIHMIKKHKINVVTREITFAPHNSHIIVTFSYILYMLNIFLCNLI